MIFSIKFKQKKFQDVSGITHGISFLLNASIFTDGAAENKLIFMKFSAVDYCELDYLKSDIIKEIHTSGDL
jgi:hypothetical protein